MTHFHSNATIYRSIAEEANAQAQRLWDEARTPKPDGSAGYTIAFDSARRSFKQSRIAMAFSAIYFEALLYLVGTQKMGRSGTTCGTDRPMDQNSQNSQNSASTMKKS